MNVVLTPDATADLDAVWRWNAQQYNVGHADDYLAFLRGAIDGLGTGSPLGTAVAGRPTYRFAVFLWRSRRHGHIAVFQSDGVTVSVLRVHHTAQDWERDFHP